VRSICLQASIHPKKPQFGLTANHSKYAKGKVCAGLIRFKVIHPLAEACRFWNPSAFHVFGVFRGFNMLVFNNIQTEHDFGLV